jgi:integrase
VPRLTDAVIKQAVAPKEGYTEIKCSDHTGLRIRIWPSGNRSFVFRYCRPGSGDYAVMALGEYGPNDMTLAKAHAAYVKARDMLDAGKDPKPKGRRKADVEARDDESLGAKIKLYDARHISNKRDGTAAYMRAELAKFEDQCGSGRLLKDVTKADVITAIEKAHKRGPNAAIQCWKVVRGFLAWCEAWSKTDYTSPAHKIPKPAEEVERERVLSDAELVTVWRAADQAGAQFGALVKLLILTGCRRNEIADLSHNEITDTEIVIPGTRTKNKVEHHVALTPAMRSVLDALSKNEDKAGTKEGEKKSGRYVLRRPGYPDRGFSGFSKAKRELKDGLADPWTLHDLRRSLSTGLQKLGVQPHIIDLATNHITVARGGKVRRTYQRYEYETEIAVAFKLWSDHIEALLSDEKVKAAA